MSFQQLACRDRANCGSLFRHFHSKLSRLTDRHDPEIKLLAKHTSPLTNTPWVFTHFALWNFSFPTTMSENAIFTHDFNFAQGVTVSLHPLFGWKKVGEKRWVKTGGWKYVDENAWVEIVGWKWTGEFEGVTCFNKICSLSTYYTQKCFHTVLI